MSLLRESLDRARARAEAPIESYLTAEIDAERELEPLRAALARLKARARPDVAVRPSTLRIARARWLDGEGSLDRLTGREIRALCSDPDIATSPAFVRAVAERGVLATKRTWLEGLITQYFVAWRSMADPSAMERLLADAVRRFDGRSGRIRRCQQEPRRLFSDEAARWLAQQLLDDRRAPEEGLATWEIAPSSGLGKATIGAAVREWADRIERAGQRLSPQDALAQFDYLATSLLRSDLVGVADAGLALCAIVLSPVVDREVELVDRIRGFVLESRRFGDPRLPANSGNWDSCGKPTRDKVASWFSKQDLDFFFRVALPSHQDPHGRRRFWERYLHQVVDCLVLLSSDDDRRLRSHTTERLHYGRTIGKQDVSAFVMRFRGASELLIIEFSRPNNAIYVHDAAQFERVTGSLRSRRQFSLDDHLKRKAAGTETFSHITGWQERMAEFLRRHNIRRSS
jgi:hypothetical protein